MRAWASHGNNHRISGSNNREVWSCDAESAEAEKITTIQTIGGNQNFSAAGRIRMPETMPVCRFRQTKTRVMTDEFARWGDGGFQEVS